MNSLPRGALALTLGCITSGVYKVLSQPDPKLGLVLTLIVGVVAWFTYLALYIYEDYKSWVCKNHVRDLHEADAREAARKFARS